MAKAISGHSMPKSVMAKATVAKATVAFPVAPPLVYSEDRIVKY